MTFTSVFLSRHWLIVILGCLMTACGNDEGAVEPETITVRFSSASLSLPENASAAYTINLALSGGLQEEGTVTMVIGDGTTATEADYTTDPAFTSGTVTLNLPKGATTASFSVTPINNSNLNDDKTILLSLSAAEGGVELAGSDLNMQITIVNDDTTPASITTSLSDLDHLGTIDNGSTSDSKSYTASGSGLTSDILVAASDNFQVSLDNINFTPSLSIPFANSNSGPVDVFVQFIPTTGTDQDISGTITHSSAGTDDVTVKVSGTESGNTISSLIFNENFDYGTTPDNITALSAWENYSGTTAAVQYVADGLSMAGYGSSDVGGAIVVENGSGSREDITRSIASQNSGKVYLAALINVNQATASDIGDFFLSLRDDVDGNFFNRLYIKDDGSGNLLIGTAKTRSGNGNEVYSSNIYSYNTTYLVVIKYDFDAKVSAMYVITGSIPATEPTTAEAVATTGLDPLSLDNISIRQSADDIRTTLDGIRIADSWKNVLGL